ncbi:N-acetylneuraminate synthase family protein [Aneurinibacillus uraniidurans]|uniref:N-acetylneuraminate synthase family protein n=1 Tax=Aneurinibacillus uraniidurans TaxID=2966586 RepID=UPI00234A4A4D|nr:N-acetylneuraminate synthase family protein [Aneurinibacillus sp. B1]WCN38144.1 N-acetylneuraminate synthase family protein [Aneurinibacillus sp. B1]
MKYQDIIYINGRKISIDSPSYFIADIASNHDGDLERAKELIWLAKEAGADAAKFQHFKAEKIVSDYGFKSLSLHGSHQATWKKSVYEVFEQYECNRSWSEELAKTAAEAQIDFMTTPYDSEALTLLDQYIPAYKIGSGDITWIDFLEQVAQREKPVILATGASTMKDVDRAIEAVTRLNKQLILLQCNTNYTGSLENFKYVNLNVLLTYTKKYPGLLLGLSDHTPGHSTVLGAIALGARVIEKHFTDDNNRIGPDHPFSMNPKTWREMVDRSRELEFSLGDGTKRVEKNEEETVVLQRRCLRVPRDMNAGEILSEDDIECLRPAPSGALEPYELHCVIGKKLRSNKKHGEALYLADFEVEKC